MKYSNSQIDKAGKSLTQGDEVTLESIELEEIFDHYRAAHLEPLSETTLELQSWLQNHGGSYYIAQRLKRKPQIIRKLKRFRTRLTQLQDIGGCRIIVDNNNDVSRLIQFIKERVQDHKNFEINKITDYRYEGRDDSGYRAVHLILKRDGKVLELQLRSRIQHYWAESIERTSIIYGYHLKEQEGDPTVIKYFKTLSDVFHEIEILREPSSQQKLSLDKLREEAEFLISQSDKNRVFYNYINEDIVKTLKEKEGGDTLLTNWIIVFDWKSGSFITWDTVERNQADDAVKKYVEYERQFTTEDSYEVVMIGSSDIASVRHTHSHYFGIEKYESILENLDQSILGFSKRMDIDVGARQILAVLVRRRFWGKKTIHKDTLKNHFVKGLITLDSSLKVLKEKDLVNMADGQSSISLNLKKKAEIEAYL